MANASQSHQVLIIGGGFAGLACAKRLAGDTRFAVTLVDRANHHLFQPLLYQVATAALAAPDIARSLRQILARARNVTTYLAEIRDLDLDGNRAIAADGRVFPFDTLVLAAGARTSYFGNDGWARHCLPLKTLADARRIRRVALANLEEAEATDDPALRQRLMTIAIVGGGPAGVELAGAFADLVRRSLRRDFRHIDTRQMRVALIEASPRLLGAFDADQGEFCRRRLERDGVEVLTGRRVADIGKGVIHFTGGETLEAGAIIWAAGVEAESLAAKLGVPAADRAGRIAPEPDLSLPGRPRVFIAGDITSLTDSAGKPVPGLAPAATQMGTHIARILKAEADGIPSPRLPFRYWDKGIMAVIGKRHAVVKTGRLKLSGALAWLVWLFTHILFIIGFRNRLAVLLGWAYAYLVDSPQARVMVEAPASETASSGAFDALDDRNSGL